MPSIGHLMIGLGGGRYPAVATHNRWRLMAALALLAICPDGDLLTLPLGVEANTLYGHRGLSHSMVVGVLLAVGFGRWARRWKVNQWQATWAALLALGSHGVLDCMNVGSKGVALFWPISSRFFEVSWHPIPAVITVEDLFRPVGLPVLLAEAVIFSPFLLYAIVGWPRFRRRVSPTVLASPDTTLRSPAGSDPRPPAA